MKGHQGFSKTEIDPIRAHPVNKHEYNKIKRKSEYNKQRWVLSQFPGKR